MVPLGCQLSLFREHCLQLDLNSCACDCSVLDNRKLIYPPGPNDTLSALTDCGGGTRDATTCGCK